MNGKSLKKQLIAQFYRKNGLCFAVAVAVSLALGSLNLILSWIMQALIDVSSGASDAISLKALMLISAGFILLCAALEMIRTASEPKFIARAMRNYKDFAFQLLTEKSLASFRDEGTARYLSALTNDASSIEADYLSQQLNVITQAITFFGALFMMLWYSPIMTAIAAGLTALPLAASILTGNRIQAAEKRVSERNRDYTAALSDCLSGFSVVKTFKAEREIFKLFSESNRALEGEKFAKRRVKLIVGMIGSLAGIIAQLGVFLAGAYLALSGRGLTAGAVILFVNLMNFIIQPVAELPTLLASRRAAAGLIEKLADALCQNPVLSGTARVNRLEKGIEFKDVSFAYGDHEVLHHVNAVFESGKAYAIVGASGSGKSTLLNLLVGGADYRGSIRLDGVELKDVAPESLYEAASLIQQNVFVFNASIEDNVTLFRSFPDSELRAAIQRAHLTELIGARGADFLCGENGKNLSGGEKQRVSIARSLLKKSSILLADEATSALDAVSAHQVSSDLMDLEGVTRILITHNLEESLLRRCDGILVLKDGKVAESGDFDSLMAKKGYFYALFTVSQ